MPDDPKKLFPAPGGAACPELEETAKTGCWGGSTFSYRDARIESLPGNHVCSLFLIDHPLSGNSFGSPGTITPLVDLWVEKRQLPAYMRQPGDTR